MVTLGILTISAYSQNAQFTSCSQKEETFTIMADSALSTDTLDCRKLTKALNIMAEYATTCGFNQQDKELSELLMLLEQTKCKLKGTK